jgi:hypothetical protein
MPIFLEEGGSYSFDESELSKEEQIKVALYMTKQWTNFLEQELDGEKE